MPKITAVKSVDIEGRAEKEDFDIPTEISISFFVFKGEVGWEGRGL